MFSQGRSLGLYAQVAGPVAPARLARLKSTPVDSLSQEDYLTLVFYVRDKYNKIDEYNKMLKSEKRLQQLREENARRQAKSHYEKGFKNGIMAGIAAVLYIMTFNQVSPFTGFTPGIKAFTAAVLGGIGNIVGAMLGGLVLGLVESLGPILVLGGLGIPSPHQLKDVVAFTVLVLVLIFRPTGILGERLAEEKA